jgi:hypothetical protein
MQINMEFPTKTNKKKFFVLLIGQDSDKGQYSDPDSDAMKSPEKID